ncbi:F-box/LRR-repeat protein [Thalictrum thalictroides]|uniref:F-box/LRR-repeat protein n=1 Tax=Thalictrum thalictroides TaxID=46969 RepID=A0A7J6V9E9_THATH|nr:F-box/LRR-repeat protein [Thalictrum thalictroides]
MSKNEAADRLSDLCDPLLHHIFSYLDMKEVVHTSLLSRRWRYTWRSVSHLNFDHTLWPVSKKTIQSSTTLKREFMEFIDYVLFLRDASNIHKFHLNGSSYCEDHRLVKWLTVIVGRKVQEISLQVWKSFSLSQFIFTYPMNIKTLHLVSAQLHENKSNGELVLRCPVLETLILTCCDHSGLKILDVSAPQLKNLELENDWNNVSRVLIKICAPNLTSLKCIGCMYRQFAMENTSSLVTAAFKYRGFSRTSVHQFIKVLKGLQNVATLELSNCWFKEMFHPSAKYWGEDLSLPYKLRKLRIHNPEGYENELKFLEIILKNAMDLECITITASARTETHNKLLDEFSQKLHSFPRASEMVRIDFVKEKSYQL